MSKDESKNENPYADIINLPHHVSYKRSHMSLEDRAAQFSPFAAVVGHEAAVAETARLTEVKRDLDEAEKVLINEELRAIQEKVQSGVEVEIEHFQADELKSGGQYVVTCGRVKRIDVYHKCLHMIGGKIIAIDDIVRVEIL